MENNKIKTHVKFIKITSTLKNNIVKLYLSNDDIKGMSQSLKNLDKEIRSCTVDQFVEMYEYLLDDTTIEELKYMVIEYSDVLILRIDVHDAAGKKLDMRNKKVKEFKQDKFKYDKHVKGFIRTIVKRSI